MLNRIDKTGLFFVLVVFAIGAILLGALFAREAGAQEPGHFGWDKPPASAGDVCAAEINAGYDIQGSTWRASSSDPWLPCGVTEPEADVPEGSIWRAWAGEASACISLWDLTPQRGVAPIVPFLREFTVQLLGTGWEVRDIDGYAALDGQYVGQTPCVQPTPDETDEQAERWTLHLYVEPEPEIPSGSC